MQELKKQRAAIKTKLTKFSNFLNDKANRGKLNEIQCRLKRIEPLLDDFELIQSEIDSQSEQPSNDFEEFENNYYAILGNAQDLIQSHNASQTTGAIVDRINSDVRGNDLFDIKLPRMELTRFDGDLNEWLNFQNSFKPLVHENERLSGIQKLHYLRSCLGPSVIAIISALENSDENYQEAWDMLEKRFNNKRLIVQKHVKVLLEAPGIGKESATEMQKLIDTTHTHLRALKSLGEPTEAWGTLLIHIITLKLDRNSHKEWEKTITGSSVPKFSDFLTFLEQRCQILRATTLSLENSLTNNHNTKKSNSYETKKQVFAISEQSDYSCEMCKGDHKIYTCSEFLQLSVYDRGEKIKTERLCFNCLRPGHRSDQCRSSKCKKCNGNHSTLLHHEKPKTFVEKDAVEPSKDENESISFKSYSTFGSSIPNEVMLATAVVDFKGRDGKLYAARILIDNCSQSNFITSKLAKELDWPHFRTDLPVESLNSVETRIKSITRIEFFSRYHNYNNTLEFLVSPVVCTRLPNQYINKTALPIPSNIKLADPTFNQPREIDALIGAEIYYDLLCIGQIRLPGHSAVLQKTKLGWVVGGKLGDTATNNSRCMLTCDSMQKHMVKFWEIEEMHDRKFLTEEEMRAEKHFKANTRRDPISGRYTVRLPFNQNIGMLGESHATAEKRFYALEKRLAKNPSLKSEYVKCMREAISLGHMREIEHNTIRKEHYYLPHHPVIKDSSSTTKVRVVFNASAATSSGISLNQCLDVGPVVQNSSFDITLRARTHQILLMSDIEKMYKQINLDRRDEQYQLLYWRENENEKLKTFVIPVVSFGNGAASHHSTSVLNLLADDEAFRFPLASMVLKRDTYVDDVMTGTDSVAEALELRDQLIQLTASGGFTLRKWVSNDSRVIHSLSEDLQNINLFHEKDADTKILGIQWNQVTDQITYTVKKIIIGHEFTKRKVLSDIAQLYDPLGLLGPVIVAAKIVMQDLWKSEVQWDESLPQSIHTSWKNIKTQLTELNHVHFDRKTVISKANRIEVHGFCDASEKAYGACIYLRSTNTDGECLVNLLCSKNRVAPVKVITIPKLELCAALLLAKLTNTVLKSMCKKIDEVYLWSDSTITLQWIKTHPSSLKTFVANRVAEIKEYTSTMHWRHVPSQDNSADALSRGQLPAEFINNILWKRGPNWLSSGIASWPPNIIEAVPLIELKPIQVFRIVDLEPHIFEKYSDLFKLVRVIAYVLRFKNNSMKNDQRGCPLLSVKEIKNAMRAIIKVVQTKYFHSEIKDLTNQKYVRSNSDLKSLHPVLDEYGIIRVGGRLTNSELTYAEKHPIVLPRGNHITRLIIEDEHTMNYHCGPRATLNSIRREYWPLNGLSAVKMVLKNCVKCFRHNPTEQNHLMGNLPSARVTLARPFLRTGIDFCGPFQIKEKKFRNRGRTKVYACIFVCFVTKAVHIELITDLTSDAFLGGLKRFFARRGCSSDLYSDNATNFVGANNELEKVQTLMNEQIKNDKITRSLTRLGVQWHFSPPNSPHFGGLWEAAVKSFKHLLYKTIGESLFTYEELLTYTTEIEAILNSRPITPLSSDPRDMHALTPAHFSIGDHFANIPEVDFTRVPTNRLSSWELIQYAKQQFWARWSREYLNNLMERTKWTQQKAADVKIGTMVIMKEDNAPPRCWPLGRITEVFPGRDGIVRVVSVKTHKGVYKRSTRRVVPLPLEDNLDNF